MRKAYYLSLLCLFAQLVWSQEYLAVRGFTDEDGLSNSSITCLFQDHHDYFWVGTKNGLNRFDGYSFNSFYSNLSDSTAISGPHVLDIFEDNEGGIWCLTKLALNYKAAGSSAFTSYFFYNDSISQVPEILTTATLDWRHNTIMVISTGSVHLFDIGNKVSTRLSISHGSMTDESLQFSIVKYSAAYNSFIISSQQKILLYEIGKDSIINIPIENQVLKYGGVIGVSAGINDEIWVYSRKHIWSIDRQFKLNLVTLPSFKGLETIINFKQLTSEKALVITDKAIYDYNIPDHSINLKLEYRHDLGINEHLTASFWMTTGVFWLGTNQALYQFNEHGHYFKAIPTKSIFRSNTLITDLTFDGANQLWISSNSNQLALLDNTQDENRNLAVYSVGERINGLFKIHNQAAVLTITNSGVSRFKAYGASLSKTSIYKGLSHTLTVEEEKDSVWIVADTSLVCASLTGEFEAIHYPLLEDFRYPVKGMYKQGKFLYLLQEYQILKYNVHTKTIESLSLRDLKLSTLPINLCFTALSKTELLLGTSNGLYILYTNNSDILPSYIDSEYLNTSIKACYKGFDNQLWITTDNELYTYNRSLNIVKPFNKAEGLQELIYQEGKVSGSDDGKVCFAAMDKVMLFSPDSVNKRRLPSGVDITQVSYIRRQKTETKDLYGEDTIQVISNYKLLRFNCTALDYRAPEKNQFQYSLVLDGKPDEWINLGTKRTFYEARTHSGFYRLRVRATNSNGEWNNNYRELVIHIIAPLWKTRFAIITYVIVVILLFYLSIYFTTRNLRQRNREYRERELIAKKVEQQKEELSQKNKNITDSINYAKRIQMALMPSQRIFTQKFPDSFILHVPKDIVSGDFYWINEVDGRTYFAAVDCTGHGVPGAFMSIIGFELFRRITEIDKKKRPADILNHLSRGFESIFRDIDNFTLRDGMDLAFCAIDPERKILEYAGAFNPLYLVRDNTISEIKGDRFSVGLNIVEEGMSPQEFTDHKIQLKDGDIIYIFTDGYADQFGGPEGKKYKYRRFRHLLLALHQLPMERQVEFLKRSIMDWKGSLDQVDDILVMGIRINQGK